MVISGVWFGGITRTGRPVVDRAMITEGVVCRVKTVRVNYNGMSDIGKTQTHLTCA